MEVAEEGESPVGEARKGSSGDPEYGGARGTQPEAAGTIRQA